MTVGNYYYYYYYYYFTLDIKNPERFEKYNRKMTGVTIIITVIVVAFVFVVSSSLF